MNLLLPEKFLLAVGSGFTLESYMIVTKFQGILWGCADILFIYFLLKISDIAKKDNNKKKIIVRYIMLWLSAVLIPFLIFTETSEQFFALESIIFALQLSALLFTAVMDAKDIMLFLQKVLTEKNMREN